MLRSLLGAAVGAPPPVYLLDFSVYKPPEELRLNEAAAKRTAAGWSMYSEDMKDFVVKVHAKSGIDPDGTFLPACINPCLAPEPRHGIPEALDEARMVMGGAVADVLEKSGVMPRDVDILVTNCSIFCPTPSLASMLVNKFKLRRDVQSYHLGGMGCGNGVVAVGLIRDLLKARPNSVALFVPAEITSYCFYPGADRRYMVANAIFRMGGAAILFSNRARDRPRAKYALVHAERVHSGADDGAYGCMAWQPDADGVNGVYLGRDIVQHASAALRHCLAAVAPRVLTWRQYGEAAAAEARKRVWGVGQGAAGYRPDWGKSAVDHFAIHAGGYAVLKGVQAALGLPAAAMLPSFAALREYGNTSCSTTWYVLAYQESAGGGVQSGQTVLQVGMGGGMKVGANVWRALRDVRDAHAAWAHLRGRPLREADLPRAIEDGAAMAEAADAAAAAKKKTAAAAVEGGGKAAAAAAGAAAIGAPAAAADKAPAPLPPLAGGGGKLARRPTVEVFAAPPEPEIVPAPEEEDAVHW